MQQESHNTERMTNVVEIEPKNKRVIKEMNGGQEELGPEVRKSQKKVLYDIVLTD